MELFDAKKYAGKRVCVALSGGVDSVSLLYALKEQAAAHAIALSALHIEHGLRGEESVRDMEFCKDMCEKWGIPLKIVRADVPRLMQERGGSAEQVARAVRYAEFRSLLARGEADLVATAHHADDVAETVLFRLARGTGTAGMRAIEEYGGVVRPLLSCTRDEIEAYAAQKNLPHVDDSTNGDENYTRNYIRHTVLPAFEGIHGNAKRHLVEFAALAAEEDAFLEALAAERIVHIAGEDRVPVDLPDVLFARACLLCLRQGGRETYSRANIAALKALKTLQSGRRAALPLSEGGAAIYAVRERDHIVFCGTSEDGAAFETPFLRETGDYALPAPFSVRELAPTGEKFDTYRTKKGELVVDLDAFPAGCVVRTRREGDVITPCNGPKKTLKKFLTDRKISARLSRRLPVVAEGSEVYLVVGVELADSVKVTARTLRPALIV